MSFLQPYLAILGEYVGSFQVLFVIGATLLLAPVVTGQAGLAIKRLSTRKDSLSRATARGLFIVMEGAYRLAVKTLDSVGDQLHKVQVEALAIDVYRLLPTTVQITFAG